MNKKMLIALFSFFLMLFSETCYGVGDGGFGGQVGTAGESIETEGYYLKFALKELVKNAIICDCSCTFKCQCPYSGGPCDCPVADPMKGALVLFGEMGNRKSALPKIKNIISKDDYAPYLLTELALRRSDDKEDERAALKITVMDDALIKLVQGNPDENGKMQKGILPEARKELQKWALEQIKIPVSIRPTRVTCTITRCKC